MLKKRFQEHQVGVEGRPHHIGEDGLVFCRGIEADERDICGSAARDDIIWRLRQEPPWLEGNACRLDFDELAQELRAFLLGERLERIEARHEEDALAAPPLDIGCLHHHSVADGASEPCLSCNDPGSREGVQTERRADSQRLVFDLHAWFWHKVLPLDKCTGPLAGEAYLIRINAIGKTYLFRRMDARGFRTILMPWL